MMTLEEVWENLRQDPDIKATMEEVDKSYKLFKKIENLIVADLEAKLAESEKKTKDLEFRNKNLEHSLKVAPNANAGQRKRIVELKEINHKLKQQLAEKDGELYQIYSHLGVEAFGEDIHEQALKEIAEKDTEIYLLHTKLNLLKYDEAFRNLADIDEEKTDE